MSKMKLLLDVVQDLHSLAAGLEALAHAAADPGSGTSVEASPNAPADAPPRHTC